jgi:hypothetical protein
MVSVTFQERDQFSSFAQLSWCTPNSDNSERIFIEFDSFSDGTQWSPPVGSVVVGEVLTSLFYSYTDFIAFIDL